MAKDITTFTLSIESTPGNSSQHGFHLGTIESVARQIAVERFKVLAANNMPVVTVALIRGGKVFDCYDGEWASERKFD